MHHHTARHQYGLGTGESTRQALDSLHASDAQLCLSPADAFSPVFAMQKRPRPIALSQHPSRRWLCEVLRSMVGQFNGTFFDLGA